MKKKNSTMDELTSKIYLAAAQDLVRRRINLSVEKHLANTIGISMKTILDRKVKGNWWFAEVKIASMAFNCEELNNYVRTQF